MPKLLIVLNDQGGSMMDWNYDGIAMTLRRESHGHEPLVVIEEEDDHSDREKIL